VRRVTAGILAGLLVLGLGWTAVPAPSAAASSDPKVVLVVGATHGTTSQYRSWMNAVATTAAKYTKNLVKVYSPNATWSKVRSAMQGASIVVYMGHGNGFPSPYSTTLNVYSQNGMGLNKVAGEGDSNTKYYGEKYIGDEVDLAPNAVVILSHLCYASGNSEPGKAEPSLSVAKARMDNFAAGFLRAGARAVIAEGHGDPAWYVEQLFTKRWTIEQMWRGAPSRKGNEFSFASSRSSSYTVFADPNKKSGSSYEGYYRSLVTRRDPALTTEKVTGARYARTDAHPGWFVIPGAAEVIAPGGVALFEAPTLPAEPAPAVLPVGTRVRVLAAAGTAGDGPAIYEIATLDASATGFALATGLAPRDSAPPRVWEVDAGARALSPNGDGSGDTLAIAARASETVAWRVDVTDESGTRVARLTASGETASVTWDGLSDGSPLPDGAYTATITATDPWGNAPATASVGLAIDTVEPQLEGLTTQAVDPPVFTPNGDGTADTLRIRYVASEAGTARTTVKNAGGDTVASFSEAMPAGAGSATWDGRTDDGGFAPDGTYTVSLRPVDRAGNTGSSLATTVVAYGALGYVTTSVTAFHARDLDRFARSTKLSWRLLAPATVTWQVVDGTGRAVITRYKDQALGAGSYSWTWNGKLPDGRFAPSGPYWSRVTATDGATTVTQSAKFQIAAFRVFLSDSTPSRGQLITAKILTTEPLRANPKLIYTQPGRRPVTLSTVRISSSSYKVTFRLSASGPVGPLVISVAGTDRDGGRNRSKVSFAME
jgi:flagellar hook assembly protein FlgD